MIDVTAEMIEQWSEQKFEGRSKEELRAAVRFVGIEAAPASNLQSLKIKLLRHFGHEGDKPSVREVPRQTFRAPPNLKLLKDWAGRKYRVRVHAPDRDYGNRPFPVSWEGQAYFMDPRKPYQDVPAPIFHILTNTTALSLKTKWDMLKGQTDRDWLEYQRYPFSVMGITPKTELLAEGGRDWFIRDAQAHDLYADEPRENLERIWAYLTDGQRPNKDDNERNTDYWRRGILEFLGLTPEQVEAREKWDAEVAAKELEMEREAA